ncbi:hypothetical protein [Mycobacterium sp. E2479]|uniref:hypothetical protein n=1 Tax=Mycobacterium sp. E2479 TaxID=1834134 RepID=UPI0007FC9A36|nr:hypothetical protein [Mycobacterium sp. E2479]OBH56899.1 hypothetical protein A5686_25670 [Mycobacterium sp. E2479]
MREPFESRKYLDMATDQPPTPPMDWADARPLLRPVLRPQSCYRADEWPTVETLTTLRAHAIDLPAG